MITESEISFFPYRGKNKLNYTAVINHFPSKLPMTYAILPIKRIFLSKLERDKSHIKPDFLHT